LFLKYFEKQRILRGWPEWGLVFENINAVVDKSKNNSS
jgi:hypothetical protein